MDKDRDKALTCTMCKVKQETYSHIVYSQGERVCLDCKKITQTADNAAFNRYMNLRRHM